MALLPAEKGIADVFFKARANKEETNIFSTLLMDKCKQQQLYRNAHDLKYDRSRIFPRQC